MMKYATIAMTPHVIHSKKEMWMFAIWSRKPSMMMFGGVPIGVRTPPIEQAYAVMSISPVAYL